MESLIKAGAFDDAGAPPPRAGRDPRDGRRPVRRHQAQRGDRPGLAVRRARRRRRGFGVTVVGARHRRLGQDDAARPRARDARPLRLRPPAARPRAHPVASAPTAPSASCCSTRSGPTARTVTVSGLITSVQRKITKRGDAWAMVTAGGPRGRRSTCCCSRAPTSWPARCSTRTPSSPSRAGSRAPRTSRSCTARRSASPTSPTGPSGPVVITMPSTRCTLPVVEQLKDVLGTHPGVTEVRLRLMTKTSTTVMKLDDRLRVAASPALFADLKALLGSELPGRLMPTEPPVRATAGRLGRDARRRARLSLLVLGVVCGVLWWLLVDPAAYTKLRDGGAMGEDDLSKQFAADGLVRRDRRRRRPARRSRADLVALPRPAADQRLLLVLGRSSPRWRCCWSATCSARATRRPRWRPPRSATRSRERLDGATPSARLTSAGRSACSPGRSFVLLGAGAASPARQGSRPTRHPPNPPRTRAPAPLGCPATRQHDRRVARRHALWGKACRRPVLASPSTSDPAVPRRPDDQQPPRRGGRRGALVAGAAVAVVAVVGVGG